MDEVFRQTVLITYYTRLMHDRERGRPPSLYRQVAAFSDPQARRIVLDEVCPARGCEAGPYRLVERLGRGGESEVWLAAHRESCELVALKRPAEGADRQECRRSYARELEVSERLLGPGLRRAVELLEVDGEPALVLEYVDGRPLRAVIDEHAEAGPVRLDGLGAGADALIACLRFFETCAGALSRAHSAGVVHGDLNPSNVIVTPGAEPVIIDFGAAVALGGPPSDELDRGTLPYIAPERLDPAMGSADERVDVYGLAATMFEALTGRRPHEGPHDDSLLQAIVTEAPASAAAVSPAVSRRLAAILDAALRPRPGERTASCAELGRRLARESARLRRRPRLARVVAAAALATVVVLTALATSRLGREVSPPPAARAGVDVDGLIDEGYLALDDLDPDRAMARFRHALEARPDCLEAVAGVSWALLHRGEPAAAATFIEEHEERLGRSKGLEILRLLARREAAGGGTDPRADMAWKDGEPSDDPVALFIAARNLLAERARTDPGAARRAVHLFDRAILLSRADRMALYRGRAVAAGMAGDAEDAETAAAAIRQRWPDSPVAWYYAGLALEIVDRTRCERAYRRAIELDPGYGRAHAGLGWLLAQSGRAVEGERHLRRAVEVDPDLAIARVRLGYHLYGTGRTDEAHRCIRAAIELGYDGPETRFNYGANLIWAQRADEGVALARWLLEARPADVGLLTNLGACLVLAHRYEDAIATLRPVQDVDQPAAPYALGIALEESGHLDEALPCYRRVQALVGESPSPAPEPGRVDASRPRPRYPDFDAADVAAQLSWCRARACRLESIAGGGVRPDDASEAVTALLLAPGSAKDERSRLDRIAAILDGAGAGEVDADRLVACVGLAASIPAEGRRARAWMEAALERIEETVDARRTCRRQGRLLARRHSSRFREILERRDHALHSEMVEFWVEIDELLGRAGAR